MRFLTVSFLPLVAIFSFCPVTPTNASKIVDVLDRGFWKGLGKAAPSLACFLRLGLLQYDPVDYDRFSDFFRSDSTWRLAETGSFKGPDEIKEYNIAGAGSSAYYLQDPIIENLQFSFTRFDKDSRVCEFSATAISTLTSDPTVTGANVQFRSGTFTKIYVDLVEGYVKDARVFLDRGFWNEALPLVQDTPETKQYVCKVMTVDCSGILPTQTLDECLEQLEDLPFNTVDGDIFRYQKDSVSCRTLHANFAPTSPTIHCPHLAFDGMPDPMGLIKCQDDVDNGDLTFEDLFTEKELEDFRRYQLDNGLGESGTVIVNL